MFRFPGFSEPDCSPPASKHRGLPSPRAYRILSTPADRRSLKVPAGSANLEVSIMAAIVKRLATGSLTHQVLGAFSVLVFGVIGQKLRLKGLDSRVISISMKHGALLHCSEGRP